MKREIRVMGIDDSPFTKFGQGNTLILGTIFRGGLFLDGVVSTTARVDGINATKKLSEMVNRCKFRQHLQALLLDGIAVGGFNVIDIHALYQKTGIPVIVIIRKMPDLPRIKGILMGLGKKGKIRLIEKAGIPIKVGNLYVQFCGIEIQAVKEILSITCTRSLIPEPIRVAHLFAQGIYFGESRGDA
ncbi:MAG TPA: DUF99 family protein [Candidatus Nanoarchaeia archaeon]|nr:DUF99 family protein [Candidatus Nanoarchaeia archaeon]